MAMREHYAGIRLQIAYFVLMVYLMHAQIL